MGAQPQRVSTKKNNQSTRVQIPTFLLLLYCRLTNTYPLFLISLLMIFGMPQPEVACMIASATKASVSSLVICQ